MRKTVMINTKTKVEDFLINLKGKTSKDNVVKRLGVDFYSLKIIIETLPKELQEKFK